MPSDPKDISLIKCLIEQNELQKQAIQTMQALIDDYREKSEQLNRLLKKTDSILTKAMSQLEKKDSELQQERKKCKLLEQETARLREKLSSMNNTNL